jgi:hypothetical protein
LISSSSTSGAINVPYTKAVPPIAASLLLKPVVLLAGQAGVAVLLHSAADSGLRQRSNGFKLQQHIQHSRTTVSD